MARSRLIKPGFFLNEQLAELPFAGRLLFAGLWTLADRDGRLEDRPKRIKAAIFPFDDVDVDDLLAGLSDRGFILRYQAEAVAVIQIVKFAEHQTPHPRETGGKLPSREKALPSPEKAVSSLGLAQKRTPVSVSVSVPVLVSVESVEADASTPVARFPCVGRETTWPLLDSQVQEWAELYPNLDVLDECRKALAWIQANQGHRKTAKGMPRFLVGWLNRSVERGGRRQVTPTPARRLEPVNDSPQCPHTPPCDVPGRWDCIRRTQREEFERQAS